MAGRTVGRLTMSMRFKLILAFNLFLAALAVLGYFTYSQLDRSKDLSDSVSSRIITRMEHAGHLAQELDRLRSLELAYILESDPQERGKTGDQLAASLDSIDTRLAGYEETFTEEPTPRDLMRLEEDYEAYLIVHARILGLTDEGRGQEALSLHSASSSDFQALTYTAHTLWHAGFEDAEAATGEAGTLITRTQYTVIGGLLAAALLIFAIGHPSSIYINNRLRALLEGTKRVSSGEFDQPIGATSGDEFQALAKAFNGMVDSLRSARDEVISLHAQTLALQEERIAFLQDRMALVVKAQENERQRVARELHDQAGQTLTALQLGLSQIEASGPTLEVQEKAASLRQQALEAMQIIRNLARDLRPSALDELGLAVALKDYTKTYSSRTDIPVELKLFGTPRRLSAETEVTLFRIAQEGLTNVAKHAQASLATVTLAFHTSTVKLTIEDDGAGFDAERALGLEQRKSLGLIGMQERGHLIGAVLQIWSRPGKGTRLVISVPSAASEASPPERELSKPR